MSQSVDSLLGAASWMAKRHPRKTREKRATGQKLRVRESRWSFPSRLSRQFRSILPTFVACPLARPLYCAPLPSPYFILKGGLVDSLLRASNEHLPSVRVARAGGQTGYPSLPLSIPIS